MPRRRKEIIVNCLTLRRLIDSAGPREDPSDYDPDPPAVAAWAATLSAVLYADSLGRLATPRNCAAETKKSSNAELKLLADLTLLGWVEKYGTAYGITDLGRKKLKEASK